MILKCVKPIDGFTVDNTYELQGCAGEYVQLIDDNGNSVILFESYFDIVDEKEEEKPIMTRINCNQPRSMYLFFTRVKRVLYKNHGVKLSRQLSYELDELEMDAKNYYHCDAYLDRKDINRHSLPEPPEPEIVYETFANRRTR